MEVVWQDGDDWDARKRRARKDADDDSILSDEEEDRLAGLIHLDEDDNEDAALTEQAKQQLRNATALKGADVGVCASCVLLCLGSSTCRFACYGILRAAFCPTKLKEVSQSQQAFAGLAAVAPFCRVCLLAQCQYCGNLTKLQT